MWYRATPERAEDSWTGYAESRDGVQWEKPSLGLTEYQGSTDNNLVWRDRTRPGAEIMCVFKDPNPDVPEDERYKSIIALRCRDDSDCQPIRGTVAPGDPRFAPGHGVECASHRRGARPLPAARGEPQPAMRGPAGHGAAAAYPDRERAAARRRGADRGVPGVGRGPACGQGGGVGEIHRLRRLHRLYRFSCPICGQQGRRR